MSPSRRSIASARANEPSAEQLEREKLVLRLRQQKLTWDEVAAQAGYSNRGAAHKAYRRALARGFIEPAAEVRQLEATSLDTLGEILWGILLDESVPLEHRLRAVDRILRVMERRAKLLGLDHEHGIAERTLQLEAERIRLVAVAVDRVFDVLELDPSQRLVARRTLLAELKARTDDQGNVIDEAGGVVVITDVPGTRA